MKVRYERNEMIIKVIKSTDGDVDVTKSITQPVVMP
jgi:hypothetical protein